MLANVASTVYAFIDKHPNAYILATGSTNVRTRLYRMGITRFYETVSEDFYLYGQVGDDFVAFEERTEYDGFLVQRKFD